VSPAIGSDHISTKQGGQLPEVDRDDSDTVTDAWQGEQISSSGHLLTCDFTVLLHLCASDPIPSMPDIPDDQWEELIVQTVMNVSRPLENNFPPPIGLAQHGLTKQEEEEFLALCATQNTVAARALFQSDQIERVIKSVTGDLSEGETLVTNFLKEQSQVKLPRLKNGRPRTELHVCLMRFHLINEEIVTTEIPCFSAPKRGTGVYATHDDLVRHQREHHLQVPRPKNKVFGTFLWLILLLKGR
jgi:hypothetical protein